MRKDSVSFFIAALALLVLPLKWLLSAVIAALFHEICHLFVLWLLKEKVCSFRITFHGCAIVTGDMPDWKQAVSILAGPIGSLSLLLMRSKLPLIALCGFFHGAYNLLPVLPLDGGRLLRLALYRIIPKHADGIMLITGIIIRFLLISTLTYVLLCKYGFH